MSQGDIYNNMLDSVYVTLSMQTVKNQLKESNIRPEDIIDSNGVNLFSFYYSTLDQYSLPFIKELYYNILKKDKNILLNMINFKVFVYFDLYDYAIKEKKNNKIEFHSYIDEIKFLRRINNKYKEKLEKTASYQKIYITSPWHPFLKEIYEFLNEEIDFNFPDEDLDFMIDFLKKVKPFTTKVRTCIKNRNFLKSLR